MGKEVENELIEGPKIYVPISMVLNDAFGCMVNLVQIEWMAFEKAPAIDDTFWLYQFNKFDAHGTLYWCGVSVCTIVM